MGNVVYSLVDLCKNAGIVFDGNARTQIDDFHSVGLAHGTFRIYKRGGDVSEHSPKEIVDIVLRILND